MQFDIQNTIMLFIFVFDVKNVLKIAIAIVYYDKIKSRYHYPFLDLAESF